jgi:hypothetical protein
MGTSTAPSQDRKGGGNPLGSVHHPQRDLVARLDAERDEAPSDRVNVACKLAERPTPLLEEERLTRPVTRCPLVHE